jgi:hypothetical protein
MRLISFVLALFMALSVAHAEEKCHTIKQSMQELDEAVKAANYKAMAWVFQPSEKNYSVLYVYFDSAPDKIWYEIHNGNCRIMDPTRLATRVSISITAAVRDNLRNSALIYDNSPGSPLDSF